jgi:tetratricopeptide (TPR) repeat protein
MKTNAIIAAALLGLLACAQAGAATEYSSLLRTKKFVDAEKLANAKLAQDPANVEAMAAKVDAIIGASGIQRVEEAIKVGEQCVAAHPQASACHLAFGQALGNKAMNAGSMMAAMRYAGTVRDAIKKAVELEPRNIEARFALLQYYLMAPAIAGGGSGKAKDLVRETAAVSPAASQLMQAQVDIDDDQYAKAEAAVLSVQAGSDEIILDHQRELLATLGHVHLKEKRYAESERIFGLVQKRFPDSDTGWYGLGRLQQEQGHQREAIAAYDRALATTDTSTTHYRIAQVALAAGDKARAAAEFNKTLTVKTALPNKWRDDAQAQLKSLR